MQVFESREQVQAALRKQEIDVGFCGLPISDPTDVGFDFLPSHLDTGLSFVVKDYTSAELAKVGYDTVLNEILGPFQDPQAVVALLILFAFAIIFAHIFYAIELGSDDVFKDDYGPGIVDAFWSEFVYSLAFSSSHMHVYERAHVHIGPYTINGSILIVDCSCH